MTSIGKQIDPCISVKTASRKKKHRIRYGQYKDCWPQIVRAETVARWKREKRRMPINPCVIVR